MTLGETILAALGIIVVSIVLVLFAHWFGRFLYDITHDD